MSHQEKDKQNGVLGVPDRATLKLKAFSPSMLPPTVKTENAIGVNKSINNTIKVIQANCAESSQSDKPKQKASNSLNDASNDNKQEDTEPTGGQNQSIAKKKTKYWIPNKQYKEILALLQEKYPIVFGKEVKILAVGIHKRLAKEIDVAGKTLAAFFRRYCNSKSYLEAHTIGAPRYGLDGNIIGEVLEQQQARKNHFLKPHVPSEGMEIQEQTIHSNTENNE